MKNKLLTIHNFPVHILDAIILYLESGQGDLEYIEAIAKDLRKVREQYTDKSKEAEESSSKTYDENMRIISANPTSAEHTKEGQNEKTG
jgi:hypothetical protein